MFEKGVRNVIFVLFLFAVVAQLVEHPHGKGEVIGSIPINGSKWKGHQ